MNIFYSTGNPDFHNEDNIYIHLPESGIMLRITIPLGHSIDDFGLEYSTDGGWKDIKEEGYRRKE